MLKLNDSTIYPLSSPSHSKFSTEMKDIKIRLRLNEIRKDYNDQDEQFLHQSEHLDNSKINFDVKLMKEEDSPHIIDSLSQVFDLN
ncbi:hypothetical protein M0811_14221 [Anaeramoeba ignava]|uniref:Uncharacterized protein n=1 Tax=Anaeramoeba ignava TaxID=1746090 RepID=A0A9Q0LVU8_ANAIG|nr:hypothetical protein M0811_14221 [Anaeramoeba ignava]